MKTELDQLRAENAKLRDCAVTETNNSKYWRDAHDEVCTGYFDVENKLKAVTKQRDQLITALEQINKNPCYAAGVAYISNAALASIKESA